MIEFGGILHHLLRMVDLGFMEFPMIILYSVILILAGLRFRKYLLSSIGIVVIFSYYSTTLIASPLP